MFAHRAAILFAGAASLVLFAAPGSAQVDETVVLNILRNCAQIDDPTARLACFDNNIRAAGVESRNTIPAIDGVQGGGAPLVRNGATGFGREDVQTGDRFLPAPPGELAEVTAEITRVRQIGPGLYELTLDTGAVWRFTDGVPASYAPPRSGGEVVLMRGALGSFLMRYRNQETVRVERIR